MNISDGIINYYNKPTHGNPHGRRFFALGFILFTPIFLSVDSTYFALYFFDGRWLANALVIGSFFIMLNVADTRLRKLMLVFVPLGYFGEVIFSHVLGLYDYRLGHIPLYVPFGHAAVYGCGYMLHATAWAKQHDALMKKIFAVFFAAIFVGAGVFYGDIFSLIFGFLFFYRGLRRKAWNSLYYYVAFYVLLVEFAGTYFNVWVWDSLALGFIPTANPPVGVVFFYIGADSVLLRIMRFIDRKNILTPLNGIRPKENW
ncbi:MAG: hypothetical protein HRU29_06375 [Rhizobiales bacterium]|nr:hypothetical protein [Hyphomicrobiales bacterium]NRB14011.1 hypothetical protein [Hyphomicrobiales bacterium]